MHNDKSIIIVYIVTGLTWIECKQIYFSGAREHFLQYYNYMDFGLLGLYMASYSLRFVSQYRVSQANAYFNATQRMTSILQNTDPKALTIAMESFMNETQQEGKYTYFLAACTLKPLFLLYVFFNFYPLKVVSRYREPQLQAGANYSDLFIF